MNKDKFLVKDGNRAEWGVPEGYPYKEVVTIEWDGNTEGLDVPTNSIAWYRVSDAILSDEQIKSCILKNSLGMEFSISTYWDEFLNTGYITEDGVYAEFAVFVRKDHVTINRVEYETAGVYFYKSTSTTDPDYTQSAIFETTHPISSEFLPLATPTAAGAMKQAAAVANGSDLNALLASLRTAGILATE